jgi:hypothetical protein
MALSLFLLLSSLTLNQPRGTKIAPLLSHSVSPMHVVWSGAPLPLDPSYLFPEPKYANMLTAGMQ